MKQTFFWTKHHPLVVGVRTGEKRRGSFLLKWRWPFLKNYGGFFLACEDVRKMFSTSFPACAFFFFKVEISSWTLIPLFRPGPLHSGSVSWDDCDWVFPDKLRVSSFPDRLRHYARTAAQSAHSDFVGCRVYACLGVNCHLHFWQNDRGL